MRRRDLIDFPVSDVWRDHYAAQGLTYDSGRHQLRPLPTTHADPLPSSESGLTALLTLIREQETTIQSLKAELVRLKQRFPHDDSRGSFEGVE